jgi:hypothetical protein
MNMRPDLRRLASGVVPSLVLSLLLGEPHGVLAQDSLASRDSLPQFNSLRTPPSPVFVLLGVEPSSVERPNTPADLAFSVVNGTNTFTTLPTNYAIEISPYWLFGHPTLAWTDDTVRSIPTSLARTLSLSVATAAVGTSDLPVTGLGLSARASVFSGKLPRAAVDRIHRLEMLLTESTAEVERRLDTLRQVADALLFERLKTAKTQEERDAAQKEHVAAIAVITQVTPLSTQSDEEERQLQAEVQDLASTRDGFFLDLAGGAAWSAPRAIIDSASLDRWGIWTTASYTLPNLSFVGVLRWLGDNDAATQNAIDVGGRFIYARDRYAVSLEYVGRHPSGSGDDTDGWRLAGVIDYQIRPSVWLTGTFGRDYQDVQAGSLLAQIGLAVDFSKQRYRPAAPQ